MCASAPLRTAPHRRPPHSRRCRAAFSFTVSSQSGIRCVKATAASPFVAPVVSGTLFQSASFAATGWCFSAFFPDSLALAFPLPAEGRSRPSDPTTTAVERPRAGRSCGEKASSRPAGSKRAASLLNPLEKRLEKPQVCVPASPAPVSRSGGIIAAALKKGHLFCRTEVLRGQDLRAAAPAGGRPGGPRPPPEERLHTRSHGPSGVLSHGLAFADTDFYALICWGGGEVGQESTVNQIPTRSWNKRRREGFSACSLFRHSLYTIHLCTRRSAQPHHKFITRFLN